MVDVPRVQTVAVLGLGVMGGSLVRALTEASPRVHRVGWSPSLGERHLALEAGAVDDAPAAWEEAVEEADVVVLALPLEACVGMLAELEGIVPDRATVTDVASLKVPLAHAAARSGLNARWVGAHPMTGSEGTGFEHSDAGLFRGARVWVVAGDAAREHIERVRALWRSVGADPADIDGAAHDRLMAWASHLPQLISNALAAELARRGIDPDRLGPGGRDMTRLAGSSPAMWGDLLRHAPEGLPDGLRGVAALLGEMASAVERGDVDALTRRMAETRAWGGGS
jgi:prephenate dehydrogenase